MLRSDQTCVWIGGGVRWGEVMCVDRREVRWCVWIGGLKRSKVEGKLTVGLHLARWSDYREGSVERWCVDRRSKTVKGGRKTHRGFAFGSVIELPWRIGGEVSSVWVAGLVVKEMAELFLSLTLSLFCAWLGNGLKVKWKCKTISGSNE